MMDGMIFVCPDPEKDLAVRTESVDSRQLGLALTMGGWGASCCGQEERYDPSDEGSVD